MNGTERNEISEKGGLYKTDRGRLTTGIPENQNKDALPSLRLAGGAPGHFRDRGYMTESANILTIFLVNLSMLVLSKSSLKLTHLLCNISETPSPLYGKIGCISASESGLQPAFDKLTRQA